MLFEEFATVEQRFATVEQRFATVEQRFATVEQRFATVEQRFATVEQELAEFAGSFNELSARQVEPLRCPREAYGIGVKPLVDGEVLSLPGCSSNRRVTSRLHLQRCRATDG